MKFPLTNESTTNQESKVRSLFVAILCLFIAVCILNERLQTNYANDFERGERQPGDHLVNNSTISNPKIPWKEMKATIYVTCPPNEIITYVKISSLNSKKIIFLPSSDGVGMSALTVLVIGKMNEGL
ncbi:uncharacterized protein LOC105185332 [Harpegnathos saltator]|uniref:Uncharacterized protein n=1 Tax=Harpegnathos saltator TaxID=610380 RepID=E2B2I2_HARSA|nr:uncharacterized protein LOC105185332 [Harpegnathos saltator]EFN90097.1 hypothetical protein EAI_16091 [Harpegnathos saltator]